MRHKFLGTGDPGYHPLRKLLTVMSGLRYAMIYDFSVTYKLVLSALVMALALVLRAWVDVLLVLLVTALVLMAEMFNSAIEAICDFMETKHNEKIKVIKDIAPGRGGSHGPQHEFAVETREPAHPIMAGLPTKWMHAKDELYDRLRGPAENLTVLATAFATKEKNGTDRHEPMLMTTTFGQGRVFHTALGHAGGGKREAQQCVGFIVTLQRGAEWAVTGKVTQKVPADFPTADQVKLRE